AGCAAPPAVSSWLDPVSVATITSQAEPLVMARITPSSRIKRSFAQLTTIEINRMGQRSVYLVLIPRISGHLTARQRATFERSFDQLEIRADHRAVALARYTGSVAELGIGDPALLPIAGWPRLYYPIERVDLDAIAAANRFEL